MPRDGTMGAGGGAGVRREDGRTVGGRPPDVQAGNRVMRCQQGGGY